MGHIFNEIKSLVRGDVQDLIKTEYVSVPFDYIPALTSTNFAIYAGTEIDDIMVVIYSSDLPSETTGIYKVVFKDLLKYKIIDR